MSIQNSTLSSKRKGGNQRNRFVVANGLWLIVLTFAFLSAPASAAPEVYDASLSQQNDRVVVVPRLPLSFVANAGQFDPAVRFSLRTGRQNVWIGAGEVVLSSTSIDEAPTEAVRMRFAGADPAVEVEGRDRLPGVVNFYYGEDPEQWVAGVATYGAVAQVDLYPGITQIYRGADGGELKSEYLVAPGADPSVIRIEYSGVESLTINADGELVLQTPYGEWRESPPFVYQEIDSRRIEVAASFQTLGENQVGFAVASYDSEHELVIDPTLDFSTYLGGSDTEGGHSIAIDDDGNILVCGGTRSSDFPLANPHDNTNGGNNDLFLAKFNPTGSQLIYSTFMGGSDRELGGDLALDSDGNAYCLGWTQSFDFPTTPGSFQPSFSGVGDDAAVFKLNPAGQLVYSTYLGGNGDDQPEDIAVDGFGNAYIVGNTSSPSFPATGAFGGVWDIFLTKLDANAGNLLCSVFIGGSGFDEPTAVALDDDGDAYIVGRTQSADFPVTPGAYDSVYDGTDTAFLTKFDCAAGSLVYSTYLDGNSPRFGARQLDVAVDSSAAAYVLAPSEGSGFPATVGVYDPTFNGAIDTVVMKFDPSGARLFSTFLGGSDEDHPSGIAVDELGNVYVAGFTFSSDFPLIDPLSNVLGGTRDAFAAMLSPAGDTLLFSTFYGGSDLDSAHALALDSQVLCLTGSTDSSDFPTAAPSPYLPFQANLNGSRDAFVVCLDQPKFANLQITKTDGLIVATPGTSVTYAVVVSNLGPDDAFGATVTDQFPLALTNMTWTCSATAGSNCGAASGVGNINDTVNLLAGGSLTYTATGLIDPAATGLLENTATVEPPADVIDPTPGDNSATDIDKLIPEPELEITKDDGRVVALPGLPSTYTITVSNHGPSAANNVQISDPFPSMLLNPTWTCVAIGGASCTPSGSGPLNDTASLPVGGTVTYTVSVIIDPGFTGVIENIVTATSSSGIVSASDVTEAVADPDCPCRVTEVRRAGGVGDDFGLPADRAFRRAALNAAFPAVQWKDFDSMTSNRHFGHTFTALPQGITSATLEIRMKPHSDIPTNDDFRMVLTSSGWQYSGRIATGLPSSPGTWNSGGPARVFTFDLGALGLVSQVAADRYLDLHVQDDTAVDYAVLRMEVCRRPARIVRRGGRIDEFRSPWEPTRRRTAFTQTWPTATWKDFDSTQSNAFVGYTFGGLPRGILDASLQVRMHPHSDIPNNDSISLGRMDGQRVGQSIASLPGAGGVWSQNPATTFNFDLKNLGLLGQIASDRFFDVMVQDDTAVDYAWLRVETCGPRRFRGLPFSEIGQAQLVASPSDEDFYLIDTGESGDDGLDVFTGEAQGFCMAVGSFCPSDAKGTALDMVLTARTVTQTYQSVNGFLTFQKTGNDVDLSIAFDPPFHQYAGVEVLNNGVSVASWSGTNGAVVRVPETTCFKEFDFLDRCFGVLLSNPEQITILQGGPTVVGDQIKICRDIVVGVDPSLNRFSLQGANLPDLRVTGHTLQMFDHLHEALGDADLEASDGTLSFTNLGASGDDGISITLGEAESVRLDFVALDPLEETQVGAFLRAKAFGSLAGTTDRALGLLKITQTEEDRRFAYEADFRVLGSPTHQIQIFSGGNLVVDIVEHSGVVALADTWPEGLGRFGAGTEYFLGEHPPGTIFTIDGVDWIGDEIRILSEGDVKVDFKSKFELRAAGFEAITLQGESVRFQEVVFYDGFESGDTSRWSTRP